MSILGLLLLLLFAAAAGVMLLFRRELSRAVREPVLRNPVLIIESDDWGFGPLEQARRLQSLVTTLTPFRDGTGRCPVMTIGVVLAGPDGAGIGSMKPASYASVTLEDALLAPVREALLAGERAGVFALQLHGREHFWPPAVLETARADGSIARWLAGPVLPRTEELPSHLQSRWTDASKLPSRPLEEAEVTQAVQDETALFQRVFGAAARVVVPPTFLWTPAVERAWALRGVEYVVTPGARYEARGADGKLAPPVALVHHGERAATGVRYLVRNDYFEPALGHTAERAIAALDRNRRLGRPTLLETHRFNFVGEDAEVERALRETAHVLERALLHAPDVRFMSTYELGRQLIPPSTLIEQRWRPRLHCVMERLRGHSRLFKLACVTGLVVPAWFLWLCTRPSRAVVPA